MGQAKSERNAAELLAALGGPNRRKLARVLVALADLLDDDQDDAREDAGPERLTLEQVRLRLGLRPSKGEDPNRSGKEALRKLGVPVTKIGHAWTVVAADLEAALAREAKPLRAAAPRATPTSSAPPAEDELDGCLERAGLRRVGGRR